MLRFVSTTDVNQEALESILHAGVLGMMMPFIVSRLWIIIVYSERVVVDEFEVNLFYQLHLRHQMLLIISLCEDPVKQMWCNVTVGLYVTKRTYKLQRIEPLPPPQFLFIYFIQRNEISRFFFANSGL